MRRAGRGARGGGAPRARSRAGDARLRHRARSRDGAPRAGARRVRARARRDAPRLARAPRRRRDRDVERRHALVRGAASAGGRGAASTGDVPRAGHRRATVRSRFEPVRARPRRVRLEHARDRARARAGSSTADATSRSAEASTRSASSSPSGFESLRATCGRGPRPFRAGRDGLALGEGAAVVALVRDRGRSPSDACARWVDGLRRVVRRRAPDRARSRRARGSRARRARRSPTPGRRAIELVSAHGTATDFNDAAEARALAAVLGGRSTPSRARRSTPSRERSATRSARRGALELLAAVERDERAASRRRRRGRGRSTAACASSTAPRRTPRARRSSSRRRSAARTRRSS